MVLYPDGTVCAISFYFLVYSLGGLRLVSMDHDPERGRCSLSIISPSVTVRYHGQLEGRRWLSVVKGEKGVFIHMTSLVVGSVAFYLTLLRPRCTEYVKSAASSSCTTHVAYIFNPAPSYHRRYIKISTPPRLDVECCKSIC